MKTKKTSFQTKKRFRLQGKKELYELYELYEFLFQLFNTLECVCKRVRPAENPILLSDRTIGGSRESDPAGGW